MNGGNGFCRFTRKEEVGLGDMDDEMRGKWRKMQVRQKGFLQLLAAAGAPLKTINAWKEARKEGV
jgi:hypothetical protein